MSEALGESNQRVSVKLPVASTTGLCTLLAMLHLHHLCCCKESCPYITGGLNPNTTSYEPGISTCCSSYKQSRDQKSYPDVEGGCSITGHSYLAQIVVIENFPHPLGCCVVHIAGVELVHLVYQAIFANFASHRLQVRPVLRQ